MECFQELFTLSNRNGILILLCVQELTVLQDLETIKQLGHILKTNVRACMAVGHPFVMQVTTAHRYMYVRHSDCTLPVDIALFMLHVHEDVVSPHSHSPLRITFVCVCYSKITCTHTCTTCM